MKVSLLTSGFPDGFTEEFIKCVKQYYCKNGSFVTIASDFAAHSKTDKYQDAFLSMFRNNGIEFSEDYAIDDRVTKEKAQQYIMEADVIWISGGDTLKQIAYIKEYYLIPVLQNRHGLTIGMSAGSINMAKRVVLARDIDDNVPKLSIYDGIGLVDINIGPHLGAASEKHMKEIEEASQYATIYGIYDNTFISIVNDKMDIYGDYIKFDKADNRSDANK